ncbi:MAG: hypothetical protein IBX63_09525 [Coriobacteriia bacterium]|nr:hypothetical protein [Coriobacteriia bacterium]
MSGRVQDAASNMSGLWQRIVMGTKGLLHMHDYERFDGPGVTIERSGRVVRWTSTLDPESHAEMRKALGEGVGDLEGQMTDDVEALYRILHRYRPQDVIAAIWFRTAPKGDAASPNPNTGGGGSLAYVEYVATLYLCDPGTGIEFVVPPHVVEDIYHRVESLFTLEVWHLISRAASRETTKGKDARRDLWFRTLMNSLFVRYPGHFDHMKEMLLGIEEQMSCDLSATLGWSIADAMAVGDAIITLVDNRTNERLERGSREFEALYLRAWPAGRNRLARAVKRVWPPHRRPWNARYLYGLTAWTAFLMQDVTLFTVDELAAAAMVDRQRVASLMRDASLSLGACSEPYLRYPNPTPPLLVRPCIEVESERCLVPVPTSFSWAIRALVEERLKEPMPDGTPNVWSAYERARARFTEQQTVRQFARAFPHAGAFHSLKYSWKRDGEPVQGELDGLIIADDTALIVEVKAGTLSPEARRGAPDSLREQLDDLIGEAHGQALKAREFMRSAPVVEFQPADGGKLRVKSGEINNFVLVTVNLDPLDMFTTNLNRLVDLGVLGEGSLPWSVSYLDLVEIVAALEFPVQLLHFLKRRQRVNEIGFVEAFDEIDWFGHYLKEGLYFEHLAAERTESGSNAAWGITGYSEDLDAHLMHDERYSGPKPPIPRQPMPEGMRMMLRELEDAQHHGYLHVSEALLDLDWKSRDQFFTVVAHQIERSRIDGSSHDFTMVLDDGVSGLTFIADVDRERLQRDLLSYCQLKKYQCKCRRWVGIGKLVTSDNCLDEAIVIEAEWEQDDDMDSALEEFLPPLAEGS